MKFDWLKTLTVLPYIVMGIQQIHADAKGATKKQLALESLGLATAAADAIIPGQQPQVDAFSTAISSIIDNLVTAFHSTNAPGFGTNSITPAQ